MVRQGESSDGGGAKGGASLDLRADDEAIDLGRRRAPAVIDNLCLTPIQRNLIFRPPSRELMDRLM